MNTTTEYIIFYVMFVFLIITAMCIMFIYTDVFQIEDQNKLDKRLKIYEIIGMISGITSFILYNVLGVMTGKIAISISVSGF